jgi:hypothetical protein
MHRYCEPDGESPPSCPGGIAKAARLSRKREESLTCVLRATPSSVARSMQCTGSEGRCVVPRPIAAAGHESTGDDMAQRTSYRRSNAIVIRMGRRQG